jgi:hypothetical protein
VAEQEHQLEVFADYHQFYVCDAARITDTGEIWTEDALSRLLGVGPDLVAVSTARNMDVPVTIEIADLEPSADFDAWERVIDCGINVPSGELVVAGCTDYFPDCPRFQVNAGRYAVRVSYADLDDLSEDGLDGNDRYRVQLWPGDVSNVTIRKP